MPALDIDRQLDTAIWALLEANAFFIAVIPLGRRLKWYADGTERQRIQRGVSDYPQVSLEVSGGSMGNNAGKVFAQNSVTFTSATVDTIIPITQIVKLVITYDKEADIQTDLESAIRAALMSKWPTLGIAGITGFVTAVTKDTNPAGLFRTKIQLTVSRRSYHSTLV